MGNHQVTYKNGYKVYRKSEFFKFNIKTVGEALAEDEAHGEPAAFNYLTELLKESPLSQSPKFMEAFSNLFNTEEGCWGNPEIDYRVDFQGSLICKPDKK